MAFARRPSATDPSQYEYVLWDGKNIRKKTGDLAHGSRDSSTTCPQPTNAHPWFTETQAFVYDEHGKQRYLLGLGAIKEETWSDGKKYDHGYRVYYRTQPL